MRPPTVVVIDEHGERALQTPGDAPYRDLAVGWAKNERDRLDGDEPFL
jgi:hypothetical protein